jgi:GT2 family glycosyltransferase
MKFLIVLPVIVEEIAQKCLDTIDPKFYKNILVIDNTKDGIGKRPGIQYEHHPENLGCSRSWNIGARKVVNGKLDYLIIISATILFEDGMRGFIEDLENNENRWGLETQHIWHLIALSRKMIERCGYFDENYYPAYFEDSDYIRRWELSGIHNPMSSTHRLPKVHAAATHQGDALSMKSGIKVNMEACRNYFIKKWGYEPRYDTQENRDKLYTAPFNDPKNDVGFWEGHSIEELKKAYNL